jgi:beta-glucosidase
VSGERDIASVLVELTLEEKAKLCLGSDFWHTAAVKRLDIPAIALSDGPHGLRKQHEDVEPPGIGGSVPATCFPTASALGSSWDPDLARRVGEAIGREARAQGVAVVLGPGINLKRSPLCGRNFEYFSEDPLLSGILGAAMVSGTQSRGVGASVKHFAANNQETDRLRVSADVDERTLRELYLSSFERGHQGSQALDGHVLVQQIERDLCIREPVLLTDVLRGEWGFDGLVMSDWGAVHDRVASLAAGVDLEMPPGLGVSDAAIVAAVSDGSLDVAVLDAAVCRVLELGRRAADAETAEAVALDAHHAIARAVARECIVLLKNDDALLPLRTVPGDTVAVIGEFARTPRFQGAGSSQVNAAVVDVPLEELRLALPADVEVLFAPGYGVEETGRDDQLANEALELVRQASVVVVFLGLPPGYESEGFDRENLDLPVNQTALLARLASVNGNIVVVLANGSAVRLSDWDRHAKAVLECWLAGQAAGGAVADLLVGTANPCGRLAETVPLRLEDAPSFLNFPGEAGHVRYGEGVFVGYRSYDATRRAVSYPFGHGLSYTTFAYEQLTTSVNGSAEQRDLAVDVGVSVTNTGDRAGKEIVQLYVGDPQATVGRPPLELRAFEKVALWAGQTTRVEFRLNERDFSFWSLAAGRWIIETGVFDLAVGASSRDIRLTERVEIAGHPQRTTLDGMATLEEWLNDPDGAAALRREVGVGSAGQPNGILGNPALLRVIGNFPISSLAAFPGSGITYAIVQKLAGGVPKPRSQAPYAPRPGSQDPLRPKTCLKTANVISGHLHRAPSCKKTATSVSDVWPAGPHSRFSAHATLNRNDSTLERCPSELLRSQPHPERRRDDHVQRDKRDALQPRVLPVVNDHPHRDNSGCQGRDEPSSTCPWAVRSAFNLRPWPAEATSSTRTGPMSHRQQIQRPRQGAPCACGRNCATRRRPLACLGFPSRRPSPWLVRSRCGC